MTHRIPGVSPKSLAPLASCVMLSLTVLAGCSTWKPPGSWFGSGSSGAAESTAEPRASSTKTTVYYTGEAGMKLYSQPGFSSSYIAELPLHQKVYRSKVERGFAYVEVEGSGKTGWVDNNKLVWRLPETAESAPAPAAAKRPADAPAGEAEGESPPAGEVTTEPSPAPAEGSVLSPSAAEAQEAPPEKQPPEQDSVNPSIFSPF